RGSALEFAWTFARRAFRILWMKQPIQISALPLLKSKTIIIECGLVVIERTSIRPKFRDVQRREVEELPELDFALPDLFFRPLALGDVDHGTHELNEIAGWAENRVTYYVDISDLAAGMNDSVVQLEVRPFALCSLELHRGPG